MKTSNVIIRMTIGRLLDLELRVELQGYHLKYGHEVESHNRYGGGRRIYLLQLKAENSYCFLMDVIKNSVGFKSSWL